MTDERAAMLPDAECQRSCERLVTGSYSLMDLGEYAQCAALFAEDAVWVRGGKPVAGREAILASLEQRPDGQVTRHIVSNILVQQTGEDTAEATAVFVPLRGPVGENGFAPAPEFPMVGDLKYRFVKVDGSWLIQQLQPKPVFKA